MAPVAVAAMRAAASPLPSSLPRDFVPPFSLPFSQSQLSDPRPVPRSPGPVHYFRFFSISSRSRDSCRSDRRSFSMRLQALITDEWLLSPKNSPITG